jgi:beta-fructofuranosidase
MATAAVAPSGSCVCLGHDGGSTVAKTRRSHGRALEYNNVNANNRRTANLETRDPRCPRTVDIGRRQFLVRSAAASASVLLNGYAPAAARAEQESVQEKLAADVQRPQYHFLPPANWMNDPNGPIYWKGYYHLFYQYNPNGAYWGDMHWGHARSSDLVHWQHLPIALAPTPGGPDKDGCFSGSAFVKGGVPTLDYTGVAPEVQCLATSDDAMIRWKKYAGNPIVASPPHGLEVMGFRDPLIWREGGDWLMTVGSGLKNKGGMVLLYQSKDAIHWDYLHPLCSGPPFLSNSRLASGKYDPVAAGDMWECPDFFALGGKHVLLVSTQGAVFYLIGSYRDRIFHLETSGKVDLGSVYYAAKSFDDRGRRILWGWLREARSAAAQRAAGWAGVMSLPRLLTLGPNGTTLHIEVAPEFRKLRGRHTLHTNISARPNAATPLRGCEGDSLEIHATFLPAGAEEFGLKVRRNPDGSEETLVGYDPARRTLALDTRKSSLNPQADRAVTQGRLELGAGELLELTIFLDASVIEIFANGRRALTGRIYPTRPDSLGVALYSQAGRATLKSLDMFRLNAISSDRLTS